MSGLIECVTGLHIGGSQEGVDIGGVDAPVVRVEWLPRDLLALGRQEAKSEASGEQKSEKSEWFSVPYIPGSSLRGKMRALLEWYEGKITTSGPTGAHECGSATAAIECPICRVFGIPAKEEKGWDRLGPTRLRVQDAYPTPETLEKLDTYYGKGIYTEIKWENFLNRLTSMANPRQIERVPAGAQFRFTLVYDVLKIGNAGQEEQIRTDEEMFRPSVVVAMWLLEDSTLGGHGSRGYGRIRFRDLSLSWRSAKYYMGEEKPKPIVEKTETLEDFVNALPQDFSQAIGGGD